ncbi:PAS domain S-box-containing protein [Pontibacter aydingkolensis]|uniref:histidine kinase n=1 Tax=Pontibacter aydingkolensis TaxID=1911536 RepID=A0ABS7CZQ8_9BACT|nr:PAS domain-containing sensor histidine kinase [Pontibacter aydingkolensis]MBW7469310.1 PAS domain-containing sensor histidine kinase [Pontibacter aydingkolensis]
MSTADFDYARFFELSPDLLCIAGFDGYFKKINPAVSNLLGYTMEELYARPINSFVHPDDQKLTSQVREQLKKAKPLNHFENRYVTKCGGTVWLSWTSLPVDSDRLIFAIAKDVTHKVRLEEERNILLANLTTLNQELKQLNYTTSHDLRSPVNNLLSLFKLIDISKITDQKTLQLINFLKQTGEKLRQTLNTYVDLLTEKHSSHVIVEKVNLNESLNKVQDSISSLIKTSKASINADFSKAGSVMFNNAYLESVFLNLITNAIKYARPESTPGIAIYSVKGNGVTQLIISDNGQGFDMEKVQDKVFGLHQHFHNYSDSKGVGLYLVHQNVTSMGCKIHLESKVNEGSTFTISFPD